MGLADLYVIILFLLVSARQPRNIAVYIYASLGLYLVQMLLRDRLPGIEILAQGVRKSLMFYIACYVGSQIEFRHHRLLHNAIVVALLIVCIYAIKQKIIFGSFDYALMDAQSADIYTNMFEGEIRAFSLLSSGFHVGMSACLLCSYCLFYFRGGVSTKSLTYLIALMACYAAATRTFQAIFVVLTFYWIFKARSIAHSLAAMILIVAFISLMELLGYLSIFSSIERYSSDERLLGRSSSYELFSQFMSNDILGSIFGFGPGSAGSGLGANFISLGAPWIESHGNMLRHLFEFGIPFGTAFIMYVAIYLYRACVAKYAYINLVRCGIFIFVISGLTISSVEAWPVSVYIGLIVGMAYRAHLMSR